MVFFAGQIVNAEERKKITTHSTHKGYHFTASVFVTPFNHQDKNSALLRVPYTLVYEPENKDKMPVFILRGGPGMSGTEIARQIKEGKRVPRIYWQFLEDHPVYFIDQRGTGIFKPSMWCDTSKAFNADKVKTRSDYLSHMKAKVEYCRKKHKKFALYENQMGTLTTALDIESLRKLIKAEKIILFGESYGSLLALTYLRDHQQYVEKLVMLGVAGPDDLIFLPKRYDMALDEIDFIRKTQNRPLLRPEIEARLKKYDEGEPFGKLNRYDFLWFVMQKFQLSYGEPLYRYLKTGETKAVEKFHNELSYKKGINFKYFSAVCSIFGSKERMALAKHQAKTSLIEDAAILHFEVCKFLKVRPLADRYRSPVFSDVPTLVFSGQHDVKTPPVQAEKLSKGFSKFVHVIDGSGRHTFCLKFHCAVELRKFLDADPKTIKSKVLNLK